MSDAKMQVLAPRLSAEAAREVWQPEDIERFNVVLEALAEGLPEREALERAGFTGSYRLSSLIARAPRLHAELTAHRAAAQELTLTLAIQEALRRVSDPARAAALSTRDLTDLVRSMKPFDKAQAQRVELLLDV